MPQPAIDEMLRADLDAPRKQRHTITRIYRRLIDEHEMRDVSYPVVRAYVAEREPQIRAEAGRGPAEVFILQSHRPGAEAEVDFGEIVVRLAGELVSCSLFCLRMSFSGKAVHRVSLSGGQEAFFEGHEHAFGVLGGVPAGRVRYDNLKAAVAQVLGFTRARVENERWTAFRSHFDLDAFYCQPGITGTHEKGGVEGQIGWFRRNHLVPVPGVPSIQALNALIDQWDADDGARRIGSRARTIGELSAIEQPLLKPLPDEPFETGRWFTPRVDRFSQVTVRTNKYSVPARLIGRQVRVLLHASDLVIYDGHAEVARHEWLPGKSGTRLDLDHYLEALVRKPGALPGSTALDQARAAGKFTPVHDAWWAEARKAHGDAAGTRALIEVLLLHRHMTHEHVVAGLAAALQAGALTADAVTLEARKIADADSGQPAGPEPAATQPAVTSLTRRRLVQLPPDTRPLPSVAKYDQLLRHPPPHRPETNYQLMTSKPRHGLTEQAADAAVDQACRMLRLPTIRTQFPDLAQAAARDWVKKGLPLCLIGDSGTGKSHLLIALGTEAAMAGYRVRYTLATKLVNELVEAADDKQLTKTINRYGRVDLLCIDELGYMELDRRGAELLFQVLTEREETASVGIASNESFSGWTKTFSGPRLCAAIVDRLTFGGSIIETGTDSYRLAHTRASQQA